MPLGTRQVAETHAEEPGRGGDLPQKHSGCTGTGGLEREPEDFARPRVRYGPVISNVMVPHS